MKIHLIRGPVIIRVDGECYILGVKLRNQLIFWDNTKTLPIENTHGAKIYLVKNKKNVKSHGFHVNHQSNLGMFIWKKTVDEILRLNCKKIAIIGPTDSGKSTFSLYLANRLLDNKERPLLIDADVGQGDLAPPTCIGSVLLTEQKVDLSMIKSNYMKFIGSIQPSNNEKRIILSVNELIDKSAYYDRWIINTDGYANGKGIYYKLKLLEKTKPDCIVSLGYTRIHAKLRQYAKLSKEWKYVLLRGRKPDSVINRTQTDRYRKRIYTLSKFITQSNIYNIEKHISDIKLVYYQNVFYENSYNHGNCVDQRTLVYLFKELARSKKLNNTFVGIGSSKEIDVVNGFGIIKNFENDTVTVCATNEYFDSIYLSDLRIDNNRSSE